MNLQTVLMHEVSRPLGHEHSEGGIVAELLSPGERLTSDEVFIGDPHAIAAPPDELPDSVPVHRKA